MHKPSIRRWIILCFTGTFVLSLAISAIANYLENDRSIMNRSREDMKRCAGFVNRRIDVAGLEELRSSPDSGLYKEARHDLWNCAVSFGMENLTVYTIDPETRVRHIVFSIATEPETDAGYQKALPCGATSDEPLIPAEEQWLEGKEDGLAGAVSNGRHTQWVMGCRDRRSGEGYLVAIETSAIVQRKEVMRGFLWDILPIGVTLLLGMISLLALVQRRVIRPIGVISDSMNRFAGDGSRKPEPIMLRSNDEIGEIAASYAKMTSDISAYVSSIEALTKEKVETDVQMDVSRRIQYGLVPERTRLDGNGFRAGAMTRPARAVSGDFYDCFLRDGHSVCAVMGDVSGKGISAAIFMAMCKTMIRDKLMAGLSPAKALNETNRELCGQNPEGLFVTAFAAVLNPGTGELRYANAGHTRPVLLGSRPSLMEPDPGIVLGLFEDADIRNNRLCLAPSEGILLYTDGVTEAVNPQNQFFGEERLVDLCRAIPADADAGEILQRVGGAVSDFCDGCEPFDDMAVLALIRTGAENGEHAIPVAVSSFREIKKAVFAAAGETPETRRALLACDEALANIVSYSGATELSFCCEKQGNSLRVTFRDNGVPFDPTTAERGKMEFDELDSGGMGLELIRRTASGTHYERREDRNELILEFPLREGTEDAPKGIA